VKIITRLKLAQVLCIVILLAVAGLFARSTSQMQREIAREEVAANVLQGVTDLRYLTLEYVLYHQPRTRQQWRLRWTSLQQYINATKAFQQDDSAGLLQDIGRHLAPFGQLFDELESVHEALQAAPEKRAILLELESRLTGRILARVQAVAADGNDLARLCRQRILAVQHESALTIGVLGGLILLVVCGAMIVTARSVAGPLARLHRATEAVGGSNLPQARAQHADDEIGDLARSFDNMVERLRDTTVSRNELIEANQALQSEAETRRGAERRVLSQLERLSLLHQITRSIGERQDLRSIFQVVVRSVEDQLPVDFCAVLRPQDGALAVSCAGVRSRGLSQQLAMPEAARIPIDENGLSRCMAGELVYEPELDALDFPFPQRLARGGLGCVVLAPLLVESQVFGVLVAARRDPRDFSSSDCEFLRQLSEHAALAANQADLYGVLQKAYDDLHASQLVVMRQERLRALGQMASGIAHDINNAISPIGLYAESLLETEPGLSAQGRESLEVIARAIDDVAATVARMREFYRQREPQLALSTVKVNQLIQHAVDLTRARWSDMPQQRGQVIEMRQELGRDVPAILGVEGEIREALTNLIFNAVDAMPEGGAITLRTRLDAAGGQVLLEVQDSGTGMDEATQQRCLEPFFTTKGERGTGLGMAMVYGMAQRHGGRVTIKSQLGHGTTVCLNFPVAPDLPQVEAPEPLLPPTGLRILLVDDDPTVLSSLSDVLARDGHEITAADGGQAGINCFRTALERDEPYAVVITDLGMPYVDGRKVAETVKALAPQVPVILLTGWGQRLIPESDGADGRMVNVDQVLSKPPKIRELREALSQVAMAA
jgi:signal transduction histidine kinase/CheY-like chemotaxis protein/HAMP domain-containing protein